MSAEVIDARQRFTERQLRAICDRLPWAKYTQGLVVIENVEYPSETDNDEPPDDAA